MQEYIHIQKRANKNYGCELCNQVIHKGDTFSLEEGTYEGESLERYLHVTCFNMLDTYIRENGSEFIWDDVEEWLFQRHCSSCKLYKEDSCDQAASNCSMVRTNYK